MKATRTLKKTRMVRPLTSLWCFGADGERLALLGHGPGIVFDYEHAEGCSCDPKGMPGCKVPVVVAGLRTKKAVIRTLDAQMRPTLVPGDSINWE